MIRTLFFQPLGPALILTAGGLLLWLFSRLLWRDATVRRAPPRWWLRTPAALLAIAAAGWLWLRLSSAPAAQSLAWRWQPLTVAGATIEWRIDPWNWFVVLVILLLTAAVVLLDGGQPGEMPAPGSAERTLWLGAAAMSFVCSANAITLASGWLVLDTALTLRLYPGRQAEPAGRTWGLLAMTVPLLLFIVAMLGEAGIPTALVGGRFGRQELSLLWLLGLLRVGAYPLHFWLTSPRSLGYGAQVAVHLLGPVAGIWLLARVQELAGLSLARQPEWAALGAFALLGTALAAWTAEQSDWRWRWIAVNRASVVLLAAYVSGFPGPQTFAWPLATFCLGGALLATSLSAGRGQRVPAILGALILWGAPGTVGFMARSALIFPTELALAAPLFGVILVGEVLLVAALWESVRSIPRSEATAAAREPGIAAPDWPARLLARLAALKPLGLLPLLAVPAIVWGILPRQLASLGNGEPADLILTAAGAIGAARRSVWIGLVVSGLAGGALGIWRTQVFGQMRGWQRGISGIVGLEWLYRAAVAGLRLIGNGLQYFATLGEGEGYLGWLALASLILWVLLRG